MTVSRYYRADSVKSYLHENILSTDNSLKTTSNPNFPTTYPFTIIVNRGTSIEEVMQVENSGGNVDGIYTWVVTRGTTVEPTMTKQNHSAGSTVEHGVSARDFRESREHEDADDLVHGLGAGDGTVVGSTKSQTLTNKTLGSGTVMPMTYVTGLDDALAGKAPLNSPTFTGTVVLPSDTSIGTVTSTELGYLTNVTSDVQTQINSKAATSHSHTVNVGADSGRIVATTTSGALTTVTNTNQSGSTYLAGDLSWKTISGGGTGTVTSITAGTGITLSPSPITTSGSVSVNTSVIAPLASPTFTGTPAAPTATAGTNTTQIATTAFVQTAVSGVSAPFWYRRTADSANISTAAATFATSPSLTANTFYHFKYLAFVYFNYTGTSGTISMNHSFSNTPQEISWMFNNANDLLTGTSTVTTSVAVSNSIAGSSGKFITVEGFFQTNATTGGTFTPQVSVSAGSVNVKKASNIQLTKLSTSSASINGTWT